MEGGMTREFQAGDVVWIVPRDANLIIRCTITEVDDYFRKLEPQAYLFYWIDEPIGHSLAEDELFSTEKEAITELLGEEKEVELEMIAELETELGVSGLEVDLMKWRQRRMKFIISTWEDAPQTEDFLREQLKQFPNKVQGQDWFNPSDLHEETNS
jgi:hypothetical protein